jgi:nitrite reductase/ring-hydroxylating ferredoxin subunit
MSSLPSPAINWFQLPNAPAEGTYVAMLDEIADGSVQLYRFGSEDKPFRLLLMRSGQGLVAYVNRCAHFGVPLAETMRHLIFTPHQTLSCNVHYARYRWGDGACVSGECAGEGLIPVSLSVSDGKVLIGAWVNSQQDATHN